MYIEFREPPTPTSLSADTLGDFCNIGQRVLEQVYQVTASSVEEMLNSVNTQPDNVLQYFLKV